MKLRLKRIFLLIYYLAYSLIYAGWLFHRSLSPAIFQYSVKYFAFLLIMVFPFFLPLIIGAYLKRLGRKGVLLSVIPALVMVFIIYFTFSLHYYYTQKHLFDPFLQVPLKEFRNLPRDKKGDTFRILCLGGSTTENIGLRPEERYPSILDKILKMRYPQIDVEVLNAGRNWFTTKHSLISYVTYYQGLEPDLIIVMHAVNDIARSFSPPLYAVGEYNDLWTHFYGPSIRGARPPTFEQHLLGYFEIPANAWYARLRFKPVNYPLEAYVSLPVFEKNLKNLIEYARSKNTGVILVSQPSLYRRSMAPKEIEYLYFGKTVCSTRRNFWQKEYPSYISLCTAQEEFNKIAGKVASREGAVFVNAARVVNKDLQNFRDDVHYTPKGTRTLAEAVASAIIKEGLIKEGI